MAKIIAKESVIEGRGLFATVPIKKGETIFIFKGKIISFVVKNKKDIFEGPNWVGIGKDTWIDPPYPFICLNHSCEPNAGIKGRVTVVALKNIKEGEEITLDYSITEETDGWEMKCNCGTKNCRKVIQSIQHLPRPIFKRYLPYVGTYFKNKYYVA